MQDEVGGADLAREFQGHRRRLVLTAYRMLGSLAEAEDVVQDAWLRLSRTEPPRDLGPWLTTVVGRLCLDRLRSARARREVYVGPWLPEPLVEAPTPEERVETDESLSSAMLLVLERLSPEQRVAVVLHDALDLPFAVVAEVLGTTEGTARQHASRGRRAVDDARPARAVPRALQEAAVSAFVAAAAGGDVEALARVLAPDVVLTSDGGGRVRAALRPVVGADAVARMLAGLVAKAGVGASPAGRLDVAPAVVNGELGVVVHLVGADGSVDLSVVVPHVDGSGRVVAVDMHRNPDKLDPDGLRALAWAQGAGAPAAESPGTPSPDGRPSDAGPGAGSAQTAGSVNP